MGIFLALGQESMGLCVFRPLCSTYWPWCWDCLITFIYIYLFWRRIYVLERVDLKSTNPVTIPAAWCFPNRWPDDFERWFRPDKDLDKQIRTDFQDLVVEARKQKPSEMAGSKPLSIYRDSPGAFAYEAKAVSVTVQAIAKGFDRAAEPVQQEVFYTPLMHGENLLIQIAAGACYKGMASRGQEGSRGKGFARTSLGFARKHMDVTRAFGSFPSRNVVSGRKSTGDNVNYLKSHPGGF